MKLVHFKESNTPFDGNKGKKNAVGAFRDIYQPQVPTIVCWRMSIPERLYLLFTGRVWVSYMTYGKPLMSSLTTVYKSDVLKPAKREDLVPISTSKLTTVKKDADPTL